MLAFYSDDQSSNPDEAYSFSVKLCLKRTKINEKRPWLAHIFKKHLLIQDCLPTYLSTHLPIQLPNCLLKSIPHRFFTASTTVKNLSKMRSDNAARRYIYLSSYPTMSDHLRWKISQNCKSVGSAL